MRKILASMALCCVTSVAAAQDPVKYTTGKAVVVVCLTGKADDLADMHEAERNRDLALLKRLVLAGKVGFLTPGTKVRIVQAGILGHTVRVLDGANEGLKVDIPVELLEDTKPESPATTTRAPDPFPPVTSKKRETPTERESSAASYLKAGVNLEKLGNRTAAKQWYRKVMQEYAETKAAEMASRRLASLEPRRAKSPR